MVVLRHTRASSLARLFPADFPRPHLLSVAVYTLLGTLCLHCRNLAPSSLAFEPVFGHSMASRVSESVFGSFSGSLADYQYAAASTDSELLNRPWTHHDPPGPAAFLGLLNRLGVPILGRSLNSSAVEDQFFVGAGASYDVTRALRSLGDQHQGNSEVEQTISKELQFKKFVTKRIKPLPPHVASDSVQLAAVTNEVRILAHETLKNVPQMVKLICVAWDEVPTMGRYWPRLLIEAADYGNLAEFIAAHEDARVWQVKLALLIDVAGGVAMLHQHHVAHCDLKLENVLVFPAEPNHAPGMQYQAKLCDFGFSVILSDYEPSSTFSAVLGTEPWNAPELTFAKPIKTEQLLAADAYSFALLLSRVMMHGGTPFEGLDQEDIRRLKQDAAMTEQVGASIFSRVEYSEPQKVLIRKILLGTLSLEPQHRFPVHLVKASLLLHSLAFRKQVTHPSALSCILETLLTPR